MAKIAINIVLLPSEECIDQIIEMNQVLLKNNVRKIVLGKEMNQPHITLCMGAVEENNLSYIINIIHECLKKIESFNFEGKLTTQIISKEEKITWLEILNKDKLQSFHETIMISMKGFLNYDIDKNMFLNDNQVEEKTIQWVKGFSKLFDAPEKFNPHITVGVGELNYKNVFRFSSSDIALFKLGNYCTCEELIYKTNLR